MGQRTSKGKQDADKSKDELIDELNFLRAHRDRVKDLVSKKDVMRESEECYRALFDNVNDAIFIVDLNGRFLDVNEVAVDRLGYSREEFLAKNVSDIDTPEYAALVAERFDDIRRKGRAVFESAHVCRDGTVMPVEVSSRIIEYGGQQVMLSVIRDISERKRAEEALRESERKFRAIFDRTLQFIGLLSLDGTVLEINKTALNYIGVAQSDVVGKLFWDTPWWTHSPEMRAYLRKAVESARRGETVRFEATHRASDGRLHYFDFSIKPITDESGNAILLIPESRDITKRKQAEEALRESENKFRALAETSPAAIFLYQGDKYVYVNPLASTLTGYTREELLAGNAWDWIHPEFQALVKGRSRKRQLGEKIPHRYEVKYCSKDGREGWVDFSAGLVTYMGQPAGLAMAFDITERKQAEQMVRESEEMFRALAETSYAAVMVHRGRCYTYVNNAASHITGYATDELLSMPFWDIVHPDMREQVKSRGFARLRGELPPQNYEVKLLAANGETRWALLSSARFYQQGQPAVIFTLVDITGRKRAEAAITEAEAFKRSVLDALPSNIAVLDGDGVITYVNKSWTRFAIQNGAADNVPGVGVNYLEVCRSATGPDKEEASRALEGMLAVLRGDRESFELEYPCHSPDTRRWFRIRVTPFLGTHPGIVVYHDDITQRKLAEEALRESETRFRSIYEQAPMGIALIDSISGRFLQVNQRYGEIAGLAPGEMLARDFQSITHPDDLQADLDNMARLLRGDIPSFQMDKRYIRPDGSIVWVSLTVVPLWDAESLRKYHIAMVEDITERKRTEEELAEAKARAELYIDLMGHDINNMNQSAQGFLELALQKLEMEGKIGTDNRVLIQRPLQAVRGSSQLISNVRKLQRLSDEGVKARPIDLHDMFEGLKSNDFQTSDKEFTMVVHEVPHCVVGGSDLLRDVFSNLISNAIKHSDPEKPVTIDVRAESTEQDGRAYCRCTVEDDGPGVPDVLKPLLFQRFQRGKTKAHGKGLGLYLVKTLVEGYGGRVWVEDRVKSDHTKGARFVVMLPTDKK